MVAAQPAQVIPVTGSSTRAVATSYPTSRIVRTISSSRTRSGSKATDAFSEAKFTLAPVTPSSSSRLRSIVAAQFAHDIPVTRSSTFLIPMTFSRSEECQRGSRLRSGFYRTRHMSPHGIDTMMRLGSGSIYGSGTPTSIPSTARRKNVHSTRRDFSHFSVKASPSCNRLADLSCWQ